MYIKTSNVVRKFSRPRDYEEFKTWISRIIRQEICMCGNKKEIYRSVTCAKCASQMMDQWIKNRNTYPMRNRYERIKCVYSIK